MNRGIEAWDILAGIESPEPEEIYLTRQIWRASKKKKNRTREAVESLRRISRYYTDQRREALLALAQKNRKQYEAIKKVLV